MPRRVLLPISLKLLRDPVLLATGQTCVALPQTSSCRRAVWLAVQRHIIQGCKHLFDPGTAVLVAGGWPAGMRGDTSSGGWTAAMRRAQPLGRR